MTEIETVDDPVFPGYSAWSRLGSGGFAVVYAARRDADEVDVAIKIAARPGDRRFAREAAALRCVGPPAAPKLLETGHTRENHPYIVMERIAGWPLSDWLKGPEERPLALRIRVAAAIARAVFDVHRAGVVHRDLKPANVMLRAEANGSPDVEVALIDFGLSKLSGEGAGPAAGDELAAELTAEGAQIGTVLYMSPEQCEGRAADARADIYALGVILFELIVGRPPFDGDASSITMAHASRRPPLPSRLANTPAALDAITLRCLAKHPEDRFQSAAELAEALSGVLASGVSDSTTSESRSSPARPAQGKPSRAPVALLSLRTTAAPDAVRPLLGAENGTIARMHEDGYLIAFHRASSLDAGVRAALAVGARALAMAEDPVVHVAPILVKDSPRGTTVMGAALDQVDSWAPRRGARAVLATPEACAVIGEQAAPATESAATSEPTRDTLRESDTRRGVSASLPPLSDMTPPLRGRDELMAALGAEAETCLSKTAGLCLLVGENGHGKTRLVEALSSSLSARFPKVSSLRAAPPEDDDPDGLSRSLARIAFDLPERPEAALVRSACEGRLGESVAEALHPLVAYHLGAVDERDEAVLRVLATPGALRRAIGRAIGLGLAARAKESPLALLVDDAQWADAQSLDALEIATLSGTDAPLFVVAAARPALLSQRPAFGERAGRRSVHEVRALDEATTAALARDLLKPVEFVPDAAIEGLVRVTGGVPLHLVEAVHALRVSGKVRQRKTGEYYLAADELVSRSVTPLSERLAQRTMDELALPLREILGLASVLGMEVAVADLSAVQTLVEASSSTSEEAMDGRVGLERLARRGVLVAAGEGRYRFRHAMLRDAIEELVPPARRRSHHEAAFRYFEAQAGRRGELLPRLARHAAAAGMAEPASNAYLELAEQAARMHRHVEAEQHYSSALSLFQAERVAERERALAGRGKTRTVLERYDDALADMQEAQALAEARGDDHTVASLLLDQSTLHDFRGAHAESAAAMERAAPLVLRLGDVRLEARLASARGRTFCRQSRRADAVVELGRAATMAAEIGDTRTQTEALLLLSTSLVAEGRMAEAKRAYDEVVALCERSGDRFHLGVAHINRIWLWIKQQDHPRAIADQRISISIARELGNSTLEAFASGNIAELLYFIGSNAEALVAARRAVELFRKLHGRVIPNAALIVARVEAANGNKAEALALVEEVVTRWPAEKITKYTRAMMRLVEIVAGDPLPDETAAWDAVIDDLRTCPETDERIDAIYQAAVRATRAGRWAEARRRIADALSESPGRMWRARFDALGSSLPPPVES